MKRYKFKTSKKLKKIHRQMILNFGAENIRYEYEHYYFDIKTETIESIEAHFKKIGLALFSV
ncbi:hypothetical protein [Winogradskyella endarachnes]|uniref:Uncharacterized protein n=1 Tax=Winogradskyella endarachnes TaxID=2681965 RepID=A0A6L6U9C6_9FLAO|nr:hypothetical protein [Winogradskyella endarachnes]MUU78940.1 hypothetical protein [Winogradskyella endarachnes]